MSTMRNQSKKAVCSALSLEPFCRNFSALSESEWMHTETHQNREFCHGDSCMACMSQQACIISKEMQSRHLRLRWWMLQ